MAQHGLLFQSLFEVRQQTELWLKEHNETTTQVLGRLTPKEYLLPSDLFKSFTGCKLPEWDEQED